MKTRGSRLNKSRAPVAFALRNGRPAGAAVHPDSSLTADSALSMVSRDLRPQPRSLGRRRRPHQPATDESPWISAGWLATMAGDFGVAFCSRQLNWARFTATWNDSMMSIAPLSRASSAAQISLRIPLGPDRVRSSLGAVAGGCLSGPAHVLEPGSRWQSAR